MPESFDFYTENLIDKHFRLTPKELTAKWKEWAEMQDQSLFDYYPLERTIRFFIADKEDGLNSVHEEAQFDAIYKTIRTEFLRK